MSRWVVLVRLAALAGALSCCDAPAEDTTAHDAGDVGGPEVMCSPLPPSHIAVVFQVELNEGKKDGNCQVVDHFSWVDEAQAETVFLTGGVHDDTPLCSATRTTHCITEAQVAASNAALGDWVPNMVAMYDDGTHGDAVGSDGIWTLSMVLPYIDMAPHTTTFANSLSAESGPELLPVMGDTGSPRGSRSRFSCRPRAGGRPSRRRDRRL